MSNINKFKKKISILLLFVLFFNTSITYAVQLKVKLDQSSTYNTVVEITNNNAIINFEILIPIGTTGNFSINLPNGLEKLGIDATSSCDNTKVLSHSNNYFSFSADGQTAFCKYILNYKVGTSAIAGIYPISVLNLITGASEQQITITITNLNTISKAETIDSNSNGYIDKYKLTFSTGGLSNFSNSNLKIGTLTPSLDSISGNIVYINFTDGIYNSGDKPQIIDTDGGIFNGIGIISETTITEEDKSEPIIIEINSVNIVGANNPNISISENSKLAVKFSEKVYSSSIINSFTLLEDNVDITNSDNITFNESNGNTMYYCIGGYDGVGNCITSFDSNRSYSIQIGNNMTDLNSNVYIGGSINIDISVNDTTPPVSKSISYNSETNNGIVINGISGKNNYTNNSSGIVNLSISADDNSGIVQSMCISEDSSITNDNNCSTGWKSYSISSSFTLNGAEGPNTLYIKFRDTAGNISNIYSDSIILDKTKPVSSSSPNGGSFVNGTKNIILNCSDSISGCDKIYYTTNGTNPTSLSSSINPGNSISISGNNEIKIVKFFGKDKVGNLESSSNSKNFIFSDSYVNFDDAISITSNSDITLTGTCNNALGSSNVEYSLNGGVFLNVTTDNCDIDNTWNTNLSLNPNTPNNIIVRLKDNTTVNSSISIIQDNISPDNLNLSINNSDAYTNSTNVNLIISANDVNGIQDVCITEDSSISDNNICPGSSWELFSNTKTFELSNSQGLKRVYIKFRDLVGNISSVINDTIILETNAPTLSSNLVSGNYTGSKTIALSSTNPIYYTTDGSNPSNTSTIYSSSLNFGAVEGMVTLKAVAYGNSGIMGEIKTYSYNFGCFPSTLTNGSVSAYPNCTKTCNSGYTLTGLTCTYNGTTNNGGSSNGGSSSGGSSSGGSSSGGIGGAEVVNDNNIKNISKIEVIFQSDIKKLVSDLKSKINNLSLSAVIDKYSQYLLIPELDYYTSFDSELQNKYSKVVKGYIDFILNTDKYISTREFKYQSLASDSYNNFMKVGEIKNFENKYITKINKEGLEIYKTTYTPIVGLVNALENAMLIKLKKLLDTNTISYSTYNQTIKDYNEFILHLTIYRKYGNKAAAYKALTPGRRFLKIYKMKIIQKEIVNKVDNNYEANNQILIKDKYLFPNELKFGDYNKEVQNLQEIMKKYGLFNYETTQYFGNVTKDSLIKFSKDFLKNDNPNGVLTKDLIEKLYLLEYRN